MMNRKDWLIGSLFEREFDFWRMSSLGRFRWEEGR